MKVSTAWLQTFFDAPLPPTEKLVEALTFHSSEVEEVTGEGEDTVLDVKVLPDRAHYALCHRGIAYELAAALDTLLARDPLRSELPSYSSTEIGVQIDIQDTRATRYMAARVSGVAVGPSPQWLQTALTRVRQRPINNIVDAINYVMLSIGQPLHAFDADKIGTDSQKTIAVRSAKEGEEITTLSGDTLTLPQGTLLIADGDSGQPLGIAGVKGGQHAAVTEATTDLIIESANFDGTSIRKTSQTLKVWTDASLRFQNRPSALLAAYGMRDVLALITDIAGGTVVGVSDTYPNPESPAPAVHTSLDAINAHLGTQFSVDEIIAALKSLDCKLQVEEDSLTVTAPWERKDIVLPEDIAEEVGRVLGYDRVEPVVLPPIHDLPDQAQYYGLERIKDMLIERGFFEISTPSFAAGGEIRLANPLQENKPYLRATLVGNMQEAIVRAARDAALVVGRDAHISLFEAGTTFKQDCEHIALALAIAPLAKSARPETVLDDALKALSDIHAELALDVSKETSGDSSIAQTILNPELLAQIGEGYHYTRVTLGTYTPFSLYPFATRDVAVWVPDSVEETEVSQRILKEAGECAVRIDQFDRFEKDGRTSYAFRIVFQSSTRTLTEKDLDRAMQAITSALNAQEGWSVR